VWIDYAIYLTTGVVLASLVGLVVVLARGRGTGSTRLVCVGLLVIGLVGTVLVRPERFRETGEELAIVEVDGRFRTDVAGIIGLCLSVFRQVGPLSFIVGNDLFPGGEWDRGPTNGCEASGHTGSIDLPDSVRTGQWMLCDYVTCHDLIHA
jgi:hypothetical protein